MVDALYALGFNIKDKRIDIPNIPVKYRLAFLRGYFDGDAHIRIKNEKFDGLIITGAPVEKLSYEEVLYWTELKEIMEWSKSQDQESSRSG